MAIPQASIAGDRVVLRPNRIEFAPQLVSAAAESSGTVGRWMTWWRADLGEKEALEWYASCEKNWQSGTEYEFSVFTPAGDYLGAVGLNQFNHPNNFANLGYWIRESRQRQGFATEGARLLATFGLGTLKLNRVEIVVAEANYPSRCVAEKIGAHFEGILRNRLMVHGRALDAAMYSLSGRVGP